MPKGQKPAAKKQPTMKDKALQMGDKVRATLSSARPAVERMGDRVQKMAGTGKYAAKPKKKGKK
jgi:hypothetical protein